VSAASAILPVIAARQAIEPTNLRRLTSVRLDIDTSPLASPQGKGSAQSDPIEVQIALRAVQGCICDTLAPAPGRENSACGPACAA
jgi:hypothetical protein